MTLADDIATYILPCHSAEVKEWWNMRDGSPVSGAWNFYFGRHPELGDALLLRIIELKSEGASSGQASGNRRPPVKARR